MRDFFEAVVMTVVLVIGLAALASSACAHTPGPCVPPVPPEPKECCAFCEPEDIGCGVMVCKPGSGVNCGPCPVFQ